MAGFEQAEGLCAFEVGKEWGEVGAELAGDVGGIPCETGAGGEDEAFGQVHLGGEGFGERFGGGEGGVEGLCALEVVEVGADVGGVGASDDALRGDVHGVGGGPDSQVGDAHPAGEIVCRKGGTVGVV